VNAFPDCTITRSPTSRNEPEAATSVDHAFGSQVSRLPGRWGRRTAAARSILWSSSRLAADVSFWGTLAVVRWADLHGPLWVLCKVRNGDSEAIEDVAYTPDPFFGKGGVSDGLVAANFLRPWHMASSIATPVSVAQLAAVSTHR